MQEIKDDIQKDTQEQKQEAKVESEANLFNAGSASAGPMLRATRKEKGMSIEAVSEELNLSNSVVNAIENDSWEHLPEATYVRGYIRSYARLLGLDPADVLMSFRYNNSEQNISLDSMPRKIEDRKISFSVPKKVKILLFIAAVAGLVTYLYNDQAITLLESKLDQVTENNNTSINTQITESTIEENILDGNVVDDGAANVSISSGAVSNESPSNESTAEQTATPTDEKNDENVASPTPDEAVEKTVDASVAEGIKELLELEFNSTSWVDIRDKEGKKIIYKSFPPGDKTSVNTTLPIFVFIGNADAVAMRYQGRSIDLQQHKEEVYAKFTLNE